MEGFAINVLGPIRVTHAFLPLLRAAEHPWIVNVSSGAGSFQRILDPGTVENAVMLPVYSATKAALTMRRAQLPHLGHHPRGRLSYSSWRRIQSWNPSPSSRPFGARSRIG
jgi:NAD(P)-dependent dehydrogenase (short-subunit alcohol dehydrogenase family)